MALAPTNPAGIRRPRAIQETVARFAAALERRDATAIADCYSPDAVLLPPGHRTIVGRAGIQAFWWAGIESGLQKLELQPLSLVVRGDLAVEVGRVSMVLEREPGSAVSEPGKYIFVHRRLEADWPRSIEIFNSDGRSKPSSGPR